MKIAPQSRSAGVQDYLRLWGATLVISLLLPVQAQSQDWKWVAAPYLWLADVGLDMNVNGDPALGVSVPFSDIVDKLDSAVMIHFEGRNNDEWGFYIDLISMSLSDSSVTTIGPGGPIIGDVTTNASLDMSIYDIGALRRFSTGGDAKFDFLFGARIVDIDVAANAVLPGPGMTPIDISVGPSETDVMIGGRLTGDFNPRWHWMLRADASFGSTEGTLNGIAAIGYQFGDTGLFSLDVGYRYMSFEFESSTARGASVDADMTLSGPIVGFIFNF